MVERFHFRQRPHVFALIHKPGDVEADRSLVRISQYLARQGCVVRIPCCLDKITSELTPEESERVKTFDETNPPSDVEVLVTLGGDGTLLHVNSLYQVGKPVPLLMSFNLGSLGFLTPFLPQEYKQHLERLLHPEEEGLPVVRRQRLLVEVFSPRGKLLEERLVLNELVVDRGSGTHLAQLELFVDECHVTSVVADGLIVSTPTGSTAYSMSAGGSMVAPTAANILVTPICPHTLSFRPLVLPSSVSVVISMPEGSRGSAYCAFDGRRTESLERGSAVRVRVAGTPLPSVTHEVGANSEWFESIREKLHWNVRVPQKPLSAALNRALGEASSPTPPKYISGDVEEILLQEVEEHHHILNHRFPDDSSLESASHSG